MDEKAKNMWDIPVYPHSGLYARFSGELEQYRQSRQADKECRKAIDAVFDAAWDGMRLPAEAGKSLMDRWRGAYVRCAGGHDSTAARRRAVLPEKQGVGAECSHADPAGFKVGYSAQMSFRKAGWPDYPTAA